MLEASENSALNLKYFSTALNIHTKHLEVLIIKSPKVKKLSKPALSELCGFGLKRFDESSSDSDINDCCMQP